MVCQGYGLSTSTRTPVLIELLPGRCPVSAPRASAATRGWSLRRAFGLEGKDLSWQVYPSGTSSWLRLRTWSSWEESSPSPSSVLPFVHSRRDLQDGGNPAVRWIRTQMDSEHGEDRDPASH